MGVRPIWLSRERAVEAPELCPSWPSDPEWRSPFSISNDRNFVDYYAACNCDLDPEERVMAKAIDAAFLKLKGIKNGASKFSASASEGNRLMPSPTKDADYQVRLDAGHFDPNTKGLNVALQVNSQAKSPGLVDWAKKNLTHSNLATATFNTQAQDRNAEFNRVMEELRRKAREKIK